MITTEIQKERVISKDRKGKLEVRSSVHFDSRRKVWKANRKQSIWKGDRKGILEELQKYREDLIGGIPEPC